ncbi:hypothetical protein B296_00023126, partial [Ensete ventricosum]
MAARGQLLIAKAGYSVMFAWVASGASCRRQWVRQLGCLRGYRSRAAAPAHGQGQPSSVQWWQRRPQ